MKEKGRRLETGGWREKGEGVIQPASMSEQLEMDGNEGRRVLCLLSCVFCLAMTGCGDEKVNPVGAGTAKPEATQPTPGPFKRTVTMRNPFGGPAGNLFADGDFEMSTVSSPGGQYGVRVFNGSGTQERVLLTETGGLCHSGLRCAVFDEDSIYLLRGAAAKNGAGNVASLWAKVPEGKQCLVATAYLVECDTFDIVKKLNSNSGSPDADGWCHYQASTPPQDTALCMYVAFSVLSNMTGLLDSAVLAPNDGTVTPMLGQIWVPDAALVTRLQAVKETILKTMPIGREMRDEEGERRDE